MCLFAEQIVLFFIHFILVDLILNIGYKIKRIINNNVRLYQSLLLVSNICLNLMVSKRCSTLLKYKLSNSF